MLATALIVVAPHASGQEGEHGDLEDAVHTVEEGAIENGATEIDSHCIAIIADGGSPEDCNEAPSPILPATEELVWG